MGQVYFAPNESDPVYAYAGVDGNTYRFKKPGYYECPGEIPLRLRTIRPDLFGETKEDIKKARDVKVLKVPMVPDVEEKKPKRVKMGGQKREKPKAPPKRAEKSVPKGGKK